MHKIFFIVSLIFMSGGVQAQKINWMSMNEALEAQKKEPKKIFMDAYTTWCGPCKMLDKNTFSNKDVAEYVNENYYAVKFNAEGTETISYKEHTFKNPNFDPKRKGRNSQHTFATAMKITGYPSLAFFDEKGNLLNVTPGYRTPGQLEVFLKLFAEDDYKEITSNEEWKKYQEAFQATFKK
ncbi:thioredoxin family protein [Salinimicrobium sp. GXAS 041]|uniref:thioredoxin family protein n=1 Tax=Salinimicrobium sp. GXAS 041 TaxID=3400806 RepID=UPI003C72A1F7